MGLLILKRCINKLCLVALCVGNSPVTGEFPSQRPVARNFDVVLFYLILNQRLSKQSRRWWFETPMYPLWRHCNDLSKMRSRGLKSSLLGDRVLLILHILCHDRCWFDNARSPAISNHGVTLVSWEIAGCGTKGVHANNWEYSSKRVYLKYWNRKQNVDSLAYNYPSGVYE